MPYLTKPKRQELAKGRIPNDSGELSYQLTQVINDFYHSRPNGGWNGAIAPILAALEGARLGFMQEVVIPYEASKRAENGDVFSRG
jgi:hypothetical protein